MMSVNEPLYDELARIAGALAHPKRLRALNLLLQGPKPIEALAELLGESPANTAAHMKALRAAGLVTPARAGKYVFQHVSHDAVAKLFLCMRNAGEQLRPAVALLRAENDASASPVTTSELAQIIEAKEAVLVDLRPSEEFEVAHIPGARSMPFASLSKTASALPRRRRILAYCRGKYCPNGRRGVAVLQDAGLRAERLAFGVPERRAEGRPLEIGSVQR